MTNGQWVFEHAIALMDSGDEATGKMDSGSVRAYKHRAPGILNLLGEECAGYDERGSWTPPESLEEDLPLEDGLCRGVLPYGLAAHLLLEEDPAAANFFQQRYEELLERWRRRGARLEELTVPYGGVEMGEDGRWTDGADRTQQ